MPLECSNEWAPRADFEHKLKCARTSAIVAHSLRIQTLGGAAAVVLAILGLAGINPMYMASLATLTVAAALTFQGVAVGSCYSRAVNEAGGKHAVIDIRTGLTAEFLAGIVCLILGALSLVGVETRTLAAVGVIVLGSGVLLGAGIANRVAHFANQHSLRYTFFENMVTDAVTAASGAEVLVGGGAIVLGVITLVGTLPYTLTLVALLALGASTLITSAAVTGRVGSVWSHE
jgi:hypothetical protein